MDVDSKKEDDSENATGMDEVDIKTEKKATTTKAPPTTVEEYRKMLAMCEKKMNGLADRTSNALLKVSETRSLYNLIGTQRYLLSVQNDEGNTPLHIAIINSNFDILEMFVDIISTIPEYGILDMKNFNQLTPLLLAANQKESEVCSFLLEAGAKIHLADSTGSNFLHIACKNNDVKLFAIFMDHIKSCKLQRSQKEAIVNKLNYEGLTPLHIAVKKNCYKAVEILVSSCFCKVNVKSSKDGLTALLIAANLGLNKIVDLLLKHSEIMVDVKSYSGCTPLHLAVINKSYFVVKKLISKGANILEESPKCMNINCKVDNCRENSKPDPSDINTLTNEFPKILEYSKTHYNAYHYAFNDDIMYYLFKDEKQIEKTMLNRILLTEMRKTISKATEEELQHMDSNLKGKLLKNEDFDIVAHIEKLVERRSSGVKLTKLENYTEKQKDSLTIMYNEMGSLTIDEKNIPSVINLKEEN